MPVHRNHFGGRTFRQPMSRPESDIQEREDSADKVQAVRGSENIEKAAGRVGCEKNARGCKLTPGDYLAEQKEDSENGGDAPPVTKARVVVCEKARAGASEGEAAGD